MQEMRGNEIKEIVRERYSEVARGASCCTDACCPPEEAHLYTIAETKSVPLEAVAASAGCGNPTGLASLKAGETLVDFGSGGGIDCFLAAQAVGRDGQVIGIDMTPDMVELARSNARKLGLPNVEFHLAEMERTPLPDDSVDVVISNCVICLAPDKDLVFREAFRILRPGGRMFVSDMILAKELPAKVTADASHWVSCVAGAELKETYLERLANAGFVDVEMFSETPLDGFESWRSSVRSTNLSAIKPT